MNAKVLQLNKYYESNVGEAKRVGGVEKVVNQLSEGLSGKEINVHVLASHHFINPWNSCEKIGSIKIDEVGTLGFIFNTPISPFFPHAYRKQVQWADIAHFHVPSPLAELSHYVFGMPEKTKVVVTFHADPSKTRLGYLARLYQPILQDLLHRADRIITTAPVNSKSETLKVHVGKSQVIPLAASLPDESLSSEDIARFEKKLGYADEKVILYVGRLVYYKGLDYLLEALKQVDAQLVLVGKGDERTRLERKTRELGIANQVHFAGYVPDEELPLYYSVADIFVLPSISPAEAFGIVQVEAMSYGLPVVNTNLPTGVPFVSQHNQTGLTVPPEDAEQLASSINMLIERKEMRRRFSKNARKRARKFTVEKMVESHLRVYESLME